MITVLKLIWKIFIRQFYIINAGFFLLSFILMFGILYPAEIILIHESIINGIINSNIFTWIVMLLWMLYNLKCIFFCLRIIQKEDNTLFYNMQSVSLLKQFILLLICHISLYIPVMIYSFVVICKANEQGFKLYAAGLIFFQIIMCLIGVYNYYTHINITWKNLYRGKVFSPGLKIFNPKMGLSVFLFYYTIHSRKIVFLVLKLTGIFLLEIILDSDKEHFILRDFVLVFMIVVLLHSLLVYFYVDFLEKRMAFIRNLPISRLHKWTAFFLIFSVILLPELFFMVINKHELISIQTVVIFYCIALAALLLFTSVLYLKSMKMGPYLQTVFGIFLVFSILILSGKYIEIFFVMLSLSLILFYKNYYTYETEV